MDRAEWRLGVDVGTTNTVAMLARPDGRVDSLIFDGSPLLPSAVYADPAGPLLVGRDAWLHAAARPECIEPNPKSRIDDQVVMLGREVPVADLLAAVLGRVAAEACRVAGAPPAAAVLTHPASWGSGRRAILASAAEQAGLPEPVLVAEPIAAATHFASLVDSEIPLGSCVLVYDFGAGTFDVSVARRTGDGWRLVAAEGLPDAGGLDVDAAVVAHLGRLLAGRDRALWTRLEAPATPADLRARHRLWADVRAAKEALSRAASAPVHVPLFDETVPLGREELEALARPVLDRTVEACALALRSAGVAPTDLGAIYLVGGSSRMPLVATLLHRRFGIPPTALEQPELVVAQGSLSAATTGLSISDTETLTIVDTPTPKPDDVELDEAEPDEAEPDDGEPDPPRAGRSRIRRRLAYPLVVLLLLAAGTAVLVWWPRGHPAAAPPHCFAASGSSSPLPAGSAGDLTIDFADLNCGYATYRVMSNAGKCTLIAQNTVDGGLAWGPPRAMGAIDCAKYPQVHALDGETFAVELSTMDGQPGDWLLSHDVGRTWTDIGGPGTTNGTSLPDWSHLYTLCDVGGGCASSELFTIDPADGTQIHVAGPGFPGVRNPRRAADGSIWVSGVPAPGQYAVAVSRDNGATWKSTRFDYAGPETEGPAVQSFDGRTGYVTIVEARDKLIVFQTTDGGVTWARVATGRLPVEGLSPFGSYATKDGRLVIAGNNGLWYIADRAMNFSRLDGGPAHASDSIIVPVDGGLLAYQKFTDTNVTAYLSADGLAWRQVPSPLDGG